jgi:hypothetical protein
MSNRLITFLRILQLIVGIIIIPLIYELVIFGNSFLALWFASLEWKWIIFGGIPITLAVSTLITIIFSSIISLIKKNSIAPKILNWVLIPIIIIMALYKSYMFWTLSEFENGKQILSFILFLLMTLYSAQSISISVAKNKIIEIEN